MIESDPWKASVQMDAALTAARWDDEYRNQRYMDEPPVPFVATILDTLRAAPPVWSGAGLYVGCGNGRNYLPLVAAGLDLCGLDLSSEAIRSLVARRSVVLPPQGVVCGDFRAFPSKPRFDYLIALQVFQHGGEADIAAYFDKVAAVLKPGGLFFLRVNAASTQIWHAHTLLERHPLGGLTIRYDDGPKAGLAIHFYSEAELHARTEAAFTPLLPLREDVAVRAAPKSGTWAQWEGAWRRR